MQLSPSHRSDRSGPFLPDSPGVQQSSNSQKAGVVFPPASPRAQSIRQGDKGHNSSNETLGPSTPEQGSSDEKKERRDIHSAAEYPQSPRHSMYQMGTTEGTQPQFHIDQTQDAKGMQRELSQNQLPQQQGGHSLISTAMRSTPDANSNYQLSIGKRYPEEYQASGTRMPSGRAMQYDPPVMDGSQYASPRAPATHVSSYSTPLGSPRASYVPVQQDPGYPPQGQQGLQIEYAPDAVRRSLSHTQIAEPYSPAFFQQNPNVPQQFSSQGPYDQPLGMQESYSTLNVDYEDDSNAPPEISQPPKSPRHQPSRSPFVPLREQPFPSSTAAPSVDCKLLTLFLNMDRGLLLLMLKIHGPSSSHCSQL